MKKRFAKHLPLLVGALLVLLLVVVGYYLVSGLKDQGEPKKVIQQITVIKPPTPPPEPPPPPEEEPEPVEEELEEEVPDDPEPLPDQPSDQPAGDDLGLDAEGVAGGDSFGLTARKGGRGLLSGGGFGAYLKQELNKAVTADAELRYLDYVAVVSLDLGENGQFNNIHIALEQGSQRAKELLLALFSAMGGLGRPVPLEEREKVFRLRISSEL
ncbi:MAG: TonB-dependent receptor [Pseudomonadales bacterium]|jgi:periplasmic protein TonB|uniref:hypothetical protein n=1 Tax=unclassified Ketobacter TaxID=2639109 RepID=UPI000C4393B8|nr:MULTISPECIES: hypothetical protein [unclassified Ketobacter]MAQ25553.1 TonB-dependent receptor [Pseudomonadales bacterium]TNC90441.1 MAG: TonB-dependent receptor [Alcanivorax sp.]HAG94281.1 TonB-dependent receptor [Gammaproteobacteria bacterium]MBI25745.1 TonB-dependent receptor [Pseudomonadales bacterium]RLT91223.1 MAG: TonB-dependent receptor [Ketobacter sp. GenoA1]|tara:strand:- start:33256 stop:33894 length:639 start_codon:yes stop_codon:yes gene_type:complete